ncbi:MAG: hypothetical protein ACI4PL_07205, partial [Faecousia sp.]
WGIATPVCALARNDSVFCYYKHQFAALPCDLKSVRQNTTKKGYPFFAHSQKGMSMILWLSRLLP